MAAPKAVKTVAGTTPATPTTLSSVNPVTPLNLNTLYAAVLQLQATVNELIVNHNLHQHSALSAAPSVGLIDGNAEAAANLFTAN